MRSPLPSSSESTLPYPSAFDPALVSRARPRVDPRTLAVVLAVFGGYGVLTWFFRDLPLWLSAPLTALWLAWYGSLQHETIHHHPTSSPRLNAALGSLPLALWVPYRIYRVTHRQHHRHRGRDLTDATADPESFFLAAGASDGHGPLRRRLCRANCTLAGRLLIGPALSLQRFWSSEARRVRDGDRWRRAVWLRHVATSVLVLLWVTQVCHISLLVYGLCVVYPSMALSHLRSFAEHRAHAEPSARTITVETSRLWSLLFLNNNLHIAHHAHPGAPWHALPAIWRHMRQSAVSQELVVQGGYAQLAQRYLLTPVMPVEQALPERDSARAT